MTAEQLLNTEVRYVDAEGQEVVTSRGKADTARLARALPLRRTMSRAGQRHYSGLFWSATTRGHVPYESRLELDRLWLADFDPDVTWIAAQPLWIAGRDGEKVRRHAPDLMLTDQDGGVCLVDVKPAVFADLPKASAAASSPNCTVTSASPLFVKATSPSSAHPAVRSPIARIAHAARYVAAFMLGPSAGEGLIPALCALARAPIAARVAPP